MCIPLTPVLYFLTTAIIEVYSQCFTESFSLRDIGKSTSRAETSSPSSSYFKAVKGAHIGSALTLSEMWMVAPKLRQNMKIRAVHMQGNFPR